MLSLTGEGEAEKDHTQGPQGKEEKERQVPEKGAFRLFLRNVPSVSSSSACVHPSPVAPQIWHRIPAVKGPPPPTPLPLRPSSQETLQQQVCGTSEEASRTSDTATRSRASSGSEAGAYYIVDHHHFARALILSGIEVRALAPAQESMKEDFLLVPHASVAWPALLPGPC